jgi:FkbM family methyltransferase
MNPIKKTLAMAAMPIAQAIVRNAPPGRLREFVWRWGKWRSKNFVTEANGVIVAGNTLDLIQGYLYWFGAWEPNLTDFITRRMNEAPHRTFVDVGANIGYFSILVAKRYPRSSVVSIEAFPPTVEKLRSSVRRNALENLRIIAAAASDTRGTLELFYAGDLNEGGTTSVPGKFKAKALAVASETLSEMLTDAEMAATRLIKIDVEGAEARVIKGLAPKLALLPKDAEVVIEISADSMENSKFIFDTFNAHGFHAYELENNYDPLSYLYPHAPRGAERLSAIPSKQTDVIFSRFDVECL